MSLYSAFGLSIDSYLRMPEFSPGCEASEVVFRHGEITPPPCPTDGPARAIQPLGDGLLLYWNRIGAFLVERGESVTISPLPGVDERLVRLVLTGPAIGVLLLQRGLCVYHASVVADTDAGGALAVMAAKGEGKSTMAAALYNSGYHMMCDDIMAVTTDGGTVVAESGFPHAKLWAEAAEALVEDGEDLPQLGPDFDKRARRVTERFAGSRLPLQAVFVLERGPDACARKLSGYESLQLLLPHWYGALFAGQLMPFFGQQRHFEETALLAQMVPVYRLVRPWSIERLPDAVDEITRVLSQQRQGS